MKKYALLAVALALVFLAIFAIAAATGYSISVDLSAHDDVAAAALGVLLLWADVLLPIPSSVVMVGLGHIFGTVVGTGLSLVGLVGAAVLAWALGRSSSGFVARHIATAERERFSDLVTRWGAVAIATTRPVPIIAETVALMAGHAGLGWRPLIAGAIAGGLPQGLLYSWAGAQASHSVDGLVVIIFTLTTAGALFFVGRRLRR